MSYIYNYFYVRMNKKQIISFDIGIKNMAYCIIEYDTSDNNKTRIFKHLQVVNLNIQKNKNIQNIIDATIELLDEIMNDTSKIDPSIPIVVLIESQMTSVMRCIQTTINTYFKLIEKYEGLQIITKYLSPKHKLELLNNYPDYINDGNKSSNKYKQNKIDSINFTKWLLIHQYKNDVFLNYFNITKKKDDISDAFLMCIYYIDNND